MKSDDRNGPVKAKAKFSREFGRPQFHKVTRLTHPCRKEFDKVWGIISMTQYQSLQRVSLRLQDLKQCTRSILIFLSQIKFLLLSSEAVPHAPRLLKDMVCT